MVFHKIFSILKGPSRLFPALILGGFLLIVSLFSGCTQGASGIFADIEQEEEIKKSNLVDNTFAAAVTRADIGGTSRYYAVVGTKLFVRDADGTNWSSAGSPGSRPLAQYVVSIAGDDGDQVYAVFARMTGDVSGRIYKLRENGSWEPRQSDDPPATDVTGLAAYRDDSGGTPVDRLIATMADADGNRFLVVNPQTDTPVFHRFETNDGLSRGEDLGANRPAGKAFMAADRLWVSRNGLWFIDRDDLGNDQGDNTVRLRRVRTPKNLGSATAVKLTDSDPAREFLVVVTLDGGIYRSPDLGPGVNPLSWSHTDDWTRLGDHSRAYSDIAWLPGIGPQGRGLFLLATISYDGRLGRGYFHATPDEDFGSVSAVEPGGNYRSTELRLSGLSRIAVVPDPAGSSGMVFALTESRGMWSSPSYFAQQEDEPQWSWE